MSVRHLYLRPRHVAYFKVVGPLGFASVQAWAALERWLESVGLRSCLSVGYGLAHQPADGPSWYEAGVEITGPLWMVLAPEVRQRTIAGGVHAVLTHKGSYAGLVPAIKALKGRCASEQGLVQDPARPLIEIYRTDPLTTPEPDLLTDLCLPVRPVDVELPAPRPRSRGHLTLVA